MKLRLELATLEKLELDGVEVDKVLATGELGEFMLLPNHTSLLSNLSIGSLAYFKDDIWYWASIGGGFLQVLNNKVTVLAETLEFAHEINLERAKKALAESEENLKKHLPGSKEYDFAITTQAKAKARIHSYTKK